jgi:ribosomal protein S18 acetylase RimI-like enzyme
VNPPPMIRPARVADVPALLNLMEGLYAEDGSVPFSRDTHRHATEKLVDSPALGQIFVMEVGAVLVGYAVLTWGYSLENGGKQGLLDEMYVAPTHRGGGLAGRVLRQMETACRESGARMVRLEVERENKGAQRLYLRHGFRAHDRYLLTKWLGK